MQIESDFVSNKEMFVGLPFELPPNESAASWLDELDYVDAFAGPLDELSELAERAPSESARQWLKGMIDARRWNSQFRC